MDKAELKKEYREKAANMLDMTDEEYRNSASAAIAVNALALPEMKKARSVMLYVSVGKEPATLALISKLLDLIIIYYFYRYLRATLGFKGKLASWADKGIPILLGIENLIILSNIFYPLTFFISNEGIYQYTRMSWAEDIMLFVSSLITTVLILRSESMLNQKMAAMTFLLFPVLMYVFLGVTFGNASQYGAVLMSLIIVYCIIFCIRICLINNWSLL